MKEEIISNTGSPLRLEELYRSNPSEFAAGFDEAYEHIKEQPIAEFWQARLKFSQFRDVNEGVVSALLPNRQRGNSI
jgi:hypothetical protein